MTAPSPADRLREAADRLWSVGDAEAIPTIPGMGVPLRSLLREQADNAARHERARSMYPCTQTEHSALAVADAVLAALGGEV